MPFKDSVKFSTVILGNNSNHNAILPDTANLTPKTEIESYVDLSLLLRKL